MIDKSENIKELYASKKPFVTVYESISGFKGAIMAWDEDESNYVPWQVSYFAYDNEQDAVRDAIDWAEAEGIAFLPY